VAPLPMVRYVITKETEGYSLEDEFGLIGKNMVLTDVIAEIVDKEGYSAEDEVQELDFE